MDDAVPKPEKLDYDSSKFVDRDEALRLVLDKARRLADPSAPIGPPIQVGNPPVEIGGPSRADRRVVIFRGERGSGKTWLLRELECQLREIMGAVYADLSAIEDIAALRFTMATEKRPLALLLDNVNQTDNRLLEEIEERILNPLVREEWVLIVLAERGRTHHWTDPFLRDMSEELNLMPFERPDVEKQVQLQVPDTQASLDDIFKVGGGFPWSTYILAKNLPPPMTALDLCAGAFLESAPRSLHTYFDALCVLKAFDETRLGAFLPAHPTFAARTWSYSTCRSLCRELVKTTLVRWNADVRGYVIDEPLRLVLEARLCESNRELWKQLHCAAYRLYAAWAEQYPVSRLWWLKDKEYHERCLNQAGINLAGCPPQPDREEKGRRSD